MRNTPKTSQYLDEELIFLLQNVVCALLDDEDADSMPNDAVTFELLPGSLDVIVRIQLPMRQASRVIGRAHTMRDALCRVFGGVFQNHGYRLSDLQIIPTDAPDRASMKRSGLSSRYEPGPNNGHPRQHRGDYAR